jgi:hypothetical protein
MCRRLRFDTLREGRARESLRHFGCQARAILRLRLRTFQGGFLLSETWRLAHEKSHTYVDSCCCQVRVVPTAIPSEPLPLVLDVGFRLSIKLSPREEKSLLRERVLEVFQRMVEGRQGTAPGPGFAVV